MTNMDDTNLTFAQDDELPSSTKEYLYRFLSLWYWFVLSLVLGFGGGYYDRAFAAYPDAIRIGIGWSVQECDSLPHEDHDMPLNAVLTEREWIVAS